MKIFKTAILVCALLCVNVSAKTCTVDPGDTMSRIAAKYQISVHELLECNPQKQDNPDMVVPGEQVEIPNTSDLGRMQNRVIELVNQERARRGLTMLKANSELTAVARAKSQEMVDKNYFSHTSPTYGSPFNMMENFGIKFTAGGENIAKGQKTAEQVMKSWMNSPGHRSNILSAVYDQIGCGAAKDSNGTLTWTQLFIKSK